ncbi:hypothetical protein FSARC_13934 [Fusarium sarcochroum]|uniref:Uncharacterized protein n=1 Tax=Fusarium sarcochroum TaxID=1208366 RepID=A0A8H4SXP2_9HYPO|nr:hypothetical protein FSARC_13934 [Fusarium sarcochroum]
MTPSHNDILNTEEADGDQVTLESHLSTTREPRSPKVYGEKVESQAELMDKKGRKEASIEDRLEELWPESHWCPADVPLATEPPLKAMLDVTKCAIDCDTALDELWGSDGLFRTIMEARNIEKLSTSLCNYVLEELKRRRPGRTRARLEADPKQDSDNPNQPSRGPEQQADSLVKAKKMWKVKYPAAPRVTVNDDIEVEDSPETPILTGGGGCAKTLEYDDIMNSSGYISTSGAIDSIRRPCKKKKRDAKSPSPEEIVSQLRPDSGMSDSVLGFLARLTLALFRPPSPEKPTSQLLDTLRLWDRGSLSQAASGLNNHLLCFSIYHSHDRHWTLGVSKRNNDVEIGHVVDFKFYDSSSDRCRVAQTERRFERWLKQLFPDHKVNYQLQVSVCTVPHT